MIIFVTLFLLGYLNTFHTFLRYLSNLILIEPYIYNHPDCSIRFLFFCTLFLNCYILIIILLVFLMSYRKATKE